MTISTIKEGSTLTVEVEGRMDTTTAPTLEEKMKDALDGIEQLNIDFKALEYISSAGLRVLLSLHKKMMSQGTMTVRGANETIQEIFDVTGFCDILNIE